MSHAAAIIIGNEILTGKIQDQNSFALAKFLFERGQRLQHIETIPDEIDIIARVANKLSLEYDFVFTSGGIGPTHDDVTYESIAKAFSLPLKYNQAALDTLTQHFAKTRPGETLNTARKKMVLLPNPCELLWTKDLWVPVVVVRNVYILPGVPTLFNKMLDCMGSRLIGEKIYRTFVYTQLSEGAFAQQLGDIQESFKSVAIGSYPKYTEATYRVMITIEGTNLAEVELVTQKIVQTVDGVTDTPFAKK